MRSVQKKPMHKWRFVEAMVADVPDHKGVYVLWSGADTVRSRLLSHLSHAGSSGMANITHYSWQLCADPRRREAELERELGLSENCKAEPEDGTSALRGRTSDAQPAQET